VIAGTGVKTVYRQIIHYGTCAWGIKRLKRDPPGTLRTGLDAELEFVGTQDIADTINDPIKRFSLDKDTIGAKGEMPCGRENAPLWKYE
jgi:hypothetical protein